MVEATELAKQKYEVYRCSGFGICRGGYNEKVSGCPMHLGSTAGFEVETPRGIMTMARDILEGHLDYGPKMAEVLYRCTMCGNCRELCGATNLETWEPLFDPGQIGWSMRCDLVERGLLPPMVRDYLKAMQVHGNPYKQGQETRLDWAQGLEVPRYEGQEWLLYVGDVGAFDERGQAVARTCVRLLEAAGESFGVLGPAEPADGDDIRTLGDIWLFEAVAEKTAESLKKSGVRRLVTFSPHAYNAFKNHYSTLDEDFNVLHHSQLLAELLKNGRLAPAKGFNKKVAFHDPCFLGRQNGEYEAPREVLRASGADLREMTRTRENALCCGGGGGNFFTDMVGRGAKSPARQRVREAAGLGAEVLAVACPNCAKMLEDAVKLEDIQDRLVVMDVAEILASEVC